MSRYERNKILSDTEQSALLGACVAVVGLGGLGGYIVEQLARLGVGKIILIDGDVFSESNLNRQILCYERNLGMSKVEEAVLRISAINSGVEVIGVSEYLSNENGMMHLSGAKVVFDALDNNATRWTLLSLCNVMKIPLVYGAIAGWYGLVATELPGDGTLNAILSKAEEKGVETKLGNPSFTPGVIASLQVSEGLKILIGRGSLLRYGFLHCDLLENEIEWVDCSSV